MHHLWRQYIVFLFIATVLASTNALAATHTVRVYDFYYSPQNLVIEQGDTVVWEWIDNFHDTRAGVPPEQEPVAYQDAFRSPVQDAPNSFDVTFTHDFLVRYPAVNNRYEYFCTPHYLDGMFGSITVIRKPQAFQALALGNQEVPPAASSATADCSAELAADETQLVINCNHNVANLTAAHIHHGYIGSNGPVICDLGTGATLSATCPLTQEQANELWDGGYYVNLHSADFPSGEIRGQLVRTGTLHTVRGKVTTSTGGNLSGVRVYAGGRSALTDTSGNYTVTQVPSGVYTLSATKTGYTINPMVGTNPTLINGANVINKTFVASVVSTCSTDTDGDRICDRTEVLQGSSPDDPGSFPEIFSSPIYALWSGFLNMRNILEIINAKSKNAEVRLSLFNISGTRVYQGRFVVPQNGEKDIILNTLPGFIANSYGIIKIEFSNEFTGFLDGRLFFYRDAPGGTSSEFVFALPFSKPIRGESAVTFNTYQPSANPAERNNAVFQWLSIVNLDQSMAKKFTLRRYANSGELLLTKTLSVPPFGRIDTEGGHQEPGPSYVGLNTITPVDQQAPYMAILYRYGSDAPLNRAPRAYRFAFPLLARVPNGEAQFSPISTSHAGENWLEVANALNSPVQVTVDSHGATGARLRRDQFTLAAHAQRHVPVGSYLRPGETGFVKVSPSKRQSVIGQTMFYFRAPPAGTIASIYGSPLRQAFGTKARGSYNLFLGMKNTLRLSNTKNSNVEVLVTIQNSSNTPKLEIVELPPHGSTELLLHDTSRFLTSPNSYDLLSIESDTAQSILSDLLRIKTLPAGPIDFSAPTPLR